MRAVYNRCEKDFIGDSNSGTTHLRGHLKRYLKVKNQVDVKQRILRATLKSEAPPFQWESISSILMLIDKNLEYDCIAWVCSMYN